ASANIVINDTQPPVITYPAQGSTVFCNSDGQYLLDTWLRNHANSVATDVCSGLAVAWTNNYYENLSNGCGNTGTKSVTFTATDICGNKSSTTATFTIIDVAAPVLTIPANITIACGASTLPATTGQATATDVCAGSAAESINIWINEFHYAQGGTDNNEFVEVAGPAGTNLNNATIYLYRSTDGKFYYTRFLSGIIPNQGNGKGTLSFSFPANTIQDGIAAIALVQGPLLMDFISYGGAFRATNGSAYGITSVNVGLTESNAGPTNVSIQRTGAGRLANTFTWTGPIPRTAGAINTGQTIAAPVTPTPGPTLSYTDTYNNPGPCNRIISRKWKATDDCGLASAEKIQLIKINFGNSLVSADNGELGSDADVQKEYAEANGYFLHQNVPNPFNESTSILIESPSSQAAVMTVYNLAGKLIISEKIYLEKGDNTFEINADQLSGNGFYYYQIKTESWIDGMKMMHQQN
ncbi:MAG: T9SS type A sorting domain-containing protein, partial [Saprospiraceae bacterium]